MRPKKHETTGSKDLFRARLDQNTNMKHELVSLAGKIDWDWLDRAVAPLYSDKGRPGIETRFVLGIFCSSTFSPCPTKALALRRTRSRRGRNVLGGRLDAKFVAGYN